MSHAASVADEIRIELERAQGLFGARAIVDVVDPILKEQVGGE